MKEVAEEKGKKACVLIIYTYSFAFRRLRYTFQKLSPSECGNCLELQTCVVTRLSWSLNTAEVMFIHQFSFFFIPAVSVIESFHLLKTRMTLRGSHSEIQAFKTHTFLFFWIASPWRPVGSRLALNNSLRIDLCPVPCLWIVWMTPPNPQVKSQ